MICLVHGVVGPHTSVCDVLKLSSLVVVALFGSFFVDIVVNVIEIGSLWSGVVVSFSTGSGS